VSCRRTPQATLTQSFASLVIPTGALVGGVDAPLLSRNDQIIWQSRRPCPRIRREGSGVTGSSDYHGSERRTCANRCFSHNRIQTIGRTGEETMSEAFTIANFRSVAKGLQPGQFAIGERRRAYRLDDLDPKYKQLLDQP